MFLLDGWWNVFQSSVRPQAIIAMMEMDEPTKAIDFLRKICNDYCDQLEKVMVPDKDVWAENADFCASIRSPHS
jgi:hypothetical protein